MQRYRRDRDHQPDDTQPAAPASGESLPASPADARGTATVPGSAASLPEAFAVAGPPAEAPPAEAPPTPTPPPFAPHATKAIDIEGVNLGNPDDGFTVLLRLRVQGAAARPARFGDVKELVDDVLDPKLAAAVAALDEGKRAATLEAQLAAADKDVRILAARLAELEARRARLELELPADLAAQLVALDVETADVEGRHKQRRAERAALVPLAEGARRAAATVRRAEAKRLFYARLDELRAEARAELQAALDLAAGPLLRALTLAATVRRAPGDSAMGRERPWLEHEPLVQPLPREVPHRPDAGQQEAIRRPAEREKAATAGEVGRGR